MSVSAPVKMHEGKDADAKEMVMLPEDSECKEAVGGANG